MKKQFYRLSGLIFAGSMLLFSGCGSLSESPVRDIVSEVTEVELWQQDASSVPEGTVVTDGDTTGVATVVTSDVVISVNGYDLPWYETGNEMVIPVNGNEPFFSMEDRQRTDAFEEYSPLDDLGRCGVAYANICTKLQPTEERGDIGSVRPSGWHTVKYNGVVSGNYLYNRCHLIGYQLAGENANELNLITGTRALNVDGMLPYENQVDDYVDNSDRHVLYRVTPVYCDTELVARGVLMEAWSVEDAGEGVCFCVFVYNIQPGVEIDYATGESWLADGTYAANETANGEAQDFVLNTSSGKFHTPDCSYAESMSEANRLELHQTLAAMLDAGYLPCGVCHPEE